MELFTIAQIRLTDEGCFAVGFDAFHNVEHPDDAVEMGMENCTIAVRSCSSCSAPGFMALTRQEADYYCPLVQAFLERQAQESGEEWLVDYTADNRLVVLPLEEAIERERQWKEMMAASEV